VRNCTHLFSFLDFVLQILLRGRENKQVKIKLFKNLNFNHKEYMKILAIVDKFSDWGLFFSLFIQ